MGRPRVLLQEPNKLALASNKYIIVIGEGLQMIIIIINIIIIVRFYACILKTNKVSVNVIIIINFINMIIITCHPIPPPPFYTGCPEKNGVQLLRLIAE